MISQQNVLEVNLIPLFWCINVDKNTELERGVLFFFLPYNNKGK